MGQERKSNKEPNRGHEELGGAKRGGNRGGRRPAE